MLGVHRPLINPQFQLDRGGFIVHLWFSRRKKTENIARRHVSVITLEPLSLVHATKFLFLEQKRQRWPVDLPIICSAATCHQAWFRETRWQYPYWSSHDIFMVKWAGLDEMNGVNNKLFRRRTIFHRSPLLRWEMSSWHNVKCMFKQMRPIK